MKQVKHDEGQEVRWSTSIVIPTAFLSDTRLSLHARACGGWLAATIGTNQPKELDYEALGEALTVDGNRPSRRSLQRWIAELEACGWLIRHTSPGQKARVELVPRMVIEEDVQ